MIIDHYTLTMYAFCGMPVPIAESEDKAELLHRAARYIRARRKKGYGYDVLQPSARWELTPPDDCCMVPDDAGILAIEAVPVRTVECWYCGFDVRIGEYCRCCPETGEESDEDIDTDDDDDDDEQEED